MSIDLAAIQSALESEALALGVFDRVMTHEPKSKPGNGISLVLWAARIEPSRVASGLAAVSTLIVWNARAMIPMLREPEDTIDTDLAAAGCAYIEALAGGYTLGGIVRDVDVFGESNGTMLAGTMGYLNQDNVLYRVFTITIPMIVNDSFTEVA